MRTKVCLGFPCGSAGKESACNAGDLGLIPGLGRYPRKGKGYSLQYSGLEYSTDCIVHGVAKSQKRPEWLSLSKVCSGTQSAEVEEGQGYIAGDAFHQTNQSRWWQMTESMGLTSRSGWCGVLVQVWGVLTKQQQTETVTHPPSLETCSHEGRAASHRGGTESTA